ncbi:MAG: ABC transporter permease [Thiotrichales bacterium]|jgi:peptide/nickel transport system permease protein|nr:ABC transporter permease [Thiotrichales bacterium]
MLLLWSDIVVWLLVTSLLYFFWRLKQDTLLRERWQLVAQSRIAMASTIVLLAFVLIALADSLHFRTNDPYRPVVSALDMSLGNIATGQEKSYSAPFAIESLWQETRQTDDGRVIRAPVPLQHAGKQLDNPNDLSRDLWQRSLTFLSIGIILASLIVWMLSHLSVFSQTALPWKSAAITFIVLCGFLVWLWGMGQSYHVLGTGKVGEDVLYASLKGVRTGILIGGLTTLLTLPFAVVMGIVAGYFKGWVDDVVQYLYTTLNAVPGVLLIASAMLLAQLYLAQHADVFASEQERADVRLLLVCLVLGLTGWTGLARILRAESLKLREMEYVKAASAFGVSHVRIIGRHLLPNLGHLVLISAVLDFSGLVLAEAVLSYVGIGVDPTMPSWGNMINLARQELNREPVVWWNLLGAFVGMFTLVLSVNLLADRVQHVFNPRAQG